MKTIKLNKNEACEYIKNLLFNYFHDDDERIVAIKVVRNIYKMLNEKGRKNFLILLTNFVTNPQTKDGRSFLQNIVDINVQNVRDIRKMQEDMSAINKLLAGK